MIPSAAGVSAGVLAVYQRGWRIDSQPVADDVDAELSISKGMDD